SDGYPDPVVHLAGASQRHPGGGCLRDDADTRLHLSVLDAGRDQGSPAGRGQQEVDREAVMSVLPTSSGGLLRLDGTPVRLPGRELLRDVGFAIRPGEFTGLIGPTGAGKTTILRVILGLLAPSAG